MSKIDNILLRANAERVLSAPAPQAISVQLRDGAKNALETLRDAGELADANFYVDSKYYGIVDLADDSWWTSTGYNNGRVIIEPVPAPAKAITRENGVQTQYTIRVLLQKPIDPSDTETIDKYILLWEQISNVIRRSVQITGIVFYGAEPTLGEYGVPLLYLGVRDNMFVAQSDFIFTVIQK